MAFSKAAFVYDPHRRLLHFDVRAPAILSAAVKLELPLPPISAFTANLHINRPSSRPAARLLRSRFFLHWSIDDPAFAGSNDTERLDAFRRARDGLREAQRICDQNVIMIEFLE